ncbi:tyrosine-type recombinase/integrase [Noviherbaspirillum massiliense]|uniref:tyrosine-type recombinase/integrase n=1 Tax=Noviherbaspirillum massiliense TaxID=1465823 RepID=UPI000307D14F|nr:integrase family protein [Noviherbaspirillum massiliense]
MAKVRFTAGRVRDFQCAPGNRPAFLWDAGAPGLGLRATPGGSKAYIFQAKLRGNVIRLTIGDPATWDIAAAQAEATRLRMMIDNGQDPRQVRADALAAEQATREARQAAEAAAQAERARLAQLEMLENRKRALLARVAWDAYLAARRGKWGQQHYVDHVIAASEGGTRAKIGDRQTKAGPLATLLDRPLHAITAPVVREWLAAECQLRPTFAHNAYRKFRTFIQWCTRQPSYQDIVHVDCCVTEEVKDVVPTKKTKDGDCLQREQLPAWFSAVRRLSNPVISAYLQGLLITGARREELAQLRWTDVDFQWRSLTIHDKVEGMRTIPLTPYLATLLDALPRRNEWVFSSPTASTGRLAEPRIAHTKALAEAGLPHVSLHGLRRSFGTLCEWIEMPSGVSAQIMGHKPSALAEKHYRRRPLDLLRMWHDKIEAWMLQQAGIAFWVDGTLQSLKG